MRDKDDANHKVAEAREQLKRYEHGALADLTLTSTRFAVLVSEKDLPAIEDKADGGVTYPHITIAVDPDTPSRAARKHR